MKAYPVILQFCITAHVSSRMTNVVDDHYEKESESFYTCLGQEIKGEFESAAIQADIKHSYEDNDEFDIELPCIVENGRVFHKGEDLSDYVDIEQVKEACWQLEQSLKKWTGNQDAPVDIMKTMTQAMGLLAKEAMLTKGQSWIGISKYQTYEEVERVFYAMVLLEGSSYVEFIFSQESTAESCIEVLYNKLKDRTNG